LLDRLEQFHGKQEPCWPTDPYEFIVWWHCGYPASDDRCGKGWAALKATAGTGVDALLTASTKTLAASLKAGGMVPELRALRLKEVAMRVRDQLGGDLRSTLIGPMAEARKVLKAFPNIADPGADRILLFAGLAPLPALPSNAPHVLVRLLHGWERESYSVNYREAQRAILDGVPETFAARQRAYLLLKQHGQEICKRTNPKCEQCPVSRGCAYFQSRNRGRARSAARGSRR
jgi:endonuclease-3